MRTFTQFRLAVMFVIATFLCLSAKATDQVVNSNADAGSGSLRQAINDVSPGGNITFNLPGGNETITITSELAITKSLTINGANTSGSGVPVTVQVTTPGTSAWRIFEITASGSTINLQNMSLKGGNMGVYYGGSIQINAEATVNLTSMNISNSLATDGGGIYIAGSWSTPTNVTVTSSTFNGNSASNRGGGIHVAYYANLKINSCEFTNNNSGGNGGAIFDGGVVTITKSTLSGNYGWYGGAICNFSTATVTVVSSTISGNICGASANGGGGIYSEGTCYLLNSIVINNTPASQSGADISMGGSGSAFAYYSWYNSTYGTINTQASAPNVTTAYTSGDLGPLANNGGPTQTMAVSASSPARNNGTYVYYNGTDGYYFLDNQATPVSHKLAAWATSPAVVPADKITTDQRGSIIFGTPAIGAYNPDPPAVIVNATAGTATAGYSTLRAAFDAINAGTHRDEITIMINSSTTETAAAVLNAYGYPSSYNSVNIYPTATGLSVSGNLATPLIDLNGADNVTIDGRVNAAGSTVDMALNNTSAGTMTYTSTIRFLNGASSNTVKYCNIKGSSADLNGGVLLFSQTFSGSTGNDNNTIDHCNITCSSDANRPANILNSFGTSGKENSGNIISNNNIYNFMRKGAYSYGILLNSHNTAWTISGNSFYETTTFVPTADGGIYYMIWINNAGVNYTISGNFIGGTSASCGGSALTKSSSPQYDSEFNGIYLNTGSGTASNIQGNTIANITWNNSANRSFRGIYTAGSGDVNIGTTAANTIGAPTGNSSISYTCGATGANFYGMYLANTGTTIVSNNILGSITGTNSYDNETSIYGIFKTSSGTTTINNNIIGSTTTANSIQSGSPSISDEQDVVGISCSGNAVISNNVAANLKNYCTSNGQVAGIIAQSGAFNITNNTVRDLSNGNSSALTEWFASVIGIGNWSNSSAVTISGNTIYNLSNTYTNFSGNVIGLYYNGIIASNTISGNFIHDLSVTGAGSTSAKIYGIQNAAGATTYSNNIISLGGNTQTTIYGIYETGASANNNKLYYNTVYVGGTPASGSTNKSYALYSAVTTNTRDFRNNIFTNVRSTTGGSGLHYALYIVSSGGSLTCDYNDYLASGTGGMLGYYGADKPALPIVSGVTGNDAHSLAIDPIFASPGGTAAANYMPSATSLVAAIGTGITTDYGANTRSLTYPAMGAWEYPVEPPCANPNSGGTIAANQTICFGNTPAAFTNSAAPSGYTGTLEYKWQSSTTSSSTGFSDIPSSNAATYAPGALSATTWFQRLARVTCMADWTGAASSNVLQVTVYDQVVPVAGTISNVSCFGGSNGVVSVSVSGGTLPYTYSWSCGGTSSSVSNLSAGTYSVTVTDAHSCTGTSSASVTQPSSALTAVASVVNNVSIYLGSDGSATVTPGGGTSPWSYSWSTTPSQTAQTATSLSAGTYWVTVTDANSCTASSSATITQPTPPSGQVSDIIYSNVGGHQFRIDWTRGNGDGCAVFVFQGTTGLAPPVNNTSYPPNTVFGTTASQIGSTGWYCVYDGTGTTVTVTGLNPATEYRVHICEYELGSKTYNTGSASNNPLNNITESGLNATASVISNVSCYGLSDGSVTVSASGGNPSYTYAWSTIPVQTSQAISALTAGTYTVTVTDGVGETVTSSASITQPDVLTASAGITSNVRCFGGSDGAVSVNASGGTGPFTYLWTGGSTGSSLSNLTAGTYYVTVTDAHSCTATSSATVTEPSAALSATAGVTHVVTCHGGSDGSADVTASGGTTAYIYSWSTIPVQTTHNETGLTSGTYYVTVTDANSCTATSSVTLTQPPVVVPGLNGAENVCQNSTGNVYTTDAGMSNYHWVVSSGGIITAGGTTSDNFVTITWNVSGAKSVSVNYITPAGCTADDPTIKNVSVSPSPAPAISGPAVVSQGETATYSTPFISGHLYSWNVSNGNAQICYPDKNCIIVTWSFPCGIINPGFVTVTESDLSTGCSKTVTLLITIN